MKAMRDGEPGKDSLHHHWVCGGQDRTEKEGMSDRYSEAEADGQSDDHNGKDHTNSGEEPDGKGLFL
jgi:hypothetical protein